jgi:hypothetical protein
MGPAGATESCVGRFFAVPLLKSEPFFFVLCKLRVFLLSARCSTAADSARVEAAVRTVLRRSSGSIDLSSSSSVTSSSVGGRPSSMTQKDGGSRGLEDVWEGRGRKRESRCGGNEGEAENSPALVTPR